MIRQPATIAFFAGIIAGSLPLLLPAGRNLEYEHVWIASILITLIWPLTALAARNLATTPTQSCRGFALWILQPVALVAGLTLPGAMIFALRLSPCSPSGYGQWLCLQAIPASFVAAAFRELLILAGKKTGNSPAIRLLYWGLGVFLSLLWLGGKLWIMPQKRTADLFWGFIHGPLYDERIWLHPDLWKVRAAHLFLALAAGFAALSANSPASSERDSSHHFFRRLAVTLLLLGAWLSLVLLTWHSPVTGHGLSLLKSQFAKSHVGEGFTIFHDLDDPSIKRLAREAQFHVRDLKAKLGLQIYPHVEIFAYPDARTKKLWFGGGATDVTDVRNAGIHITAGRRMLRRHPTLRHELVHALTSRMAFHGLGFHPNMALTEGLAVALSPDANLFATISLDEAAAELLNSGRVPDPVSLFNPWTFWLSSGPRAYTTAGSLIKFLISKEGVQPILDIYAGKSWHEVYPTNSMEIVAAWQEHLNRTARPGLSAKIQARTMFRSGGVVFDVCPHSFADRLAKNPSDDDLRRMATATNDPGYLLMVARRQARSAFEERIPQDRAARMAKLLNDLPADPSWPPPDEESIEFRILASDMMRLTHQGVAGSIPDPLTRLAILNGQHPLPPPLARQVVIRQRLDQFVANGQLGSKRAQDWRNYLAGWAPLPKRKDAEENNPATEPWVLVYLRVRAAFNNGDQTESTGYTAEELARMTPDRTLAGTAPGFAFEWYRHLAELLERDGRGALAQSAWAAAAENSPNSTARECMLENKQMIEGI
ncbi:MAG: hypothetical protein RIQ81_976 [Pseudomonadota bacterium]